MAIDFSDLADVITQELEAYQQEVTDDIKDSVKKAAKVCVKTLEATSPEQTGDYKKGWRAKTAYESPLDIRVQVYNKTDYQLTHLLEEGHAKVDGGRVPAYPHIVPAAGKASELLAKDVQTKVSKR